MKLLRTIFFAGFSLFSVLPAYAADGSSGCPVGSVFFRNIGYGALAGLVVGTLVAVANDKEQEDVPAYLARGALIGGGVGIAITGVELAVSPGCSWGGGSDYASQPGFRLEPLVAVDPYEKNDVLGIKGIYQF